MIQKQRFKYKVLLEGEKLTPSTEIKRFSNTEMNPGRGGKRGDTGKACEKAELRVPKELVLAKV